MGSAVRMGRRKFAILPYRRLRPAAIGFGQLLLKATFHAVDHPKALLRLRFPNVDMRASLSPEPRTPFYLSNLLTKTAAPDKENQILS